MNSFTSLVGLPVITGNNKKIGIVLDVFYCSSKKDVFGLIIKEKGLFSPYEYIPLDEIEKINKTNIWINNINSIKKINTQDELYKIISNPNRCKIDSEVYLNGGHKLGKIKDISFNFELGIIDSYIISNGIIEDFAVGRKVLDDEETVQNKGKLIAKKI